MKTIQEILEIANDCMKEAEKKFHEAEQETYGYEKATFYELGAIYHQNNAIIELLKSGKGGKY